MTPPRITALGGGHGLAASLRALRTISEDVTAVVTVGDDGGSSGVLRRDLGVMPPGDLRMALAALAGDDAWGSTWAAVAQHRFDRGDLAGHPVGNLMLVALGEQLGDPVVALQWMAKLMGVRGQVLPMTEHPVEIVARLASPLSEGGDLEVRGQVAVATTPGTVLSIGLEPEEPTACKQAVQAITEADWVVIGPGSWFSSVLPHVLVPGLREALETTKARRIVTLNLAEQPGETHGFSPENHLEVLAAHAPDLRLDVVIADRAAVADPPALLDVAASLGAEVVFADVSDGHEPPRHDRDRLASVYADVMDRGRIAPWR